MLLMGARVHSAMCGAQQKEEAACLRRQQWLSVCTGNKQEAQAQRGPACAADRKGFACHRSAHASTDERFTCCHGVQLRASAGDVVLLASDDKAEIFYRTHVKRHSGRSVILKHGPEFQVVVPIWNKCPILHAK
jgi:hypothetical protein